MVDVGCSNLFEEKGFNEASVAEFFDRYGFRILRALRELIHVADMQSHKLKHRFKITSPQLVCLYCLDRAGPLTLSALAREVSLGPSTTTGVVDRLVAKGLVKRTRGVADHRKVELKITARGRETARMAPALLQDRFLNALQRLPELELTGIILALERVVQLMKPGSEATMPKGSEGSETARELSERKDTR